MLAIVISGYAADTITVERMIMQIRLLPPLLQRELR